MSTGDPEQLFLHQGKAHLVVKRIFLALTIICEPLLNKQNIWRKINNFPLIIITDCSPHCASTWRWHVIPLISYKCVIYCVCIKGYILYESCPTLLFMHAKLASLLLYTMSALQITACQRRCSQTAGME